MIQDQNQWFTGASHACNGGKKKDNWRQQKNYISDRKIKHYTERCKVFHRTQKQVSKICLPWKIRPMSNSLYQKTATLQNPITPTDLSMPIMPHPVSFQQRNLHLTFFSPVPKHTEGCLALRLKIANSQFHLVRSLYQQLTHHYSQVIKFFFLYEFQSNRTKITLNISSPF